MKNPFSPIKLLICDVDGVLTSGEIIVSDQHHEIKAFHVHDGFGIELLLKKNIEVAIISGRNVPSVEKRAQQLGIKHVYQGATQKVIALEDLLKKLQLDPQAVACVGDDWPDLPLFHRVGLPIAVANAVPEVKAKTAYITHFPKTN